MIFMADKFQMKIVKFGYVLFWVLGSLSILFGFSDYFYGNTRLFFEKVITGIILLAGIPFGMFTGMVELEVSNSKITIYRGTKRVKAEFDVNDVKSFYINKILLKNDKVIPLSFSRFVNWDVAVLEVYNALKDVDGIYISPEIKKLTGV